VKNSIFRCALFCALTALTLQADALYNVTIDTSPLIAHPAGPFALDLQLNDGSGTGNGNNTAILRSFNFASGDPSGTPTTVGQSSGNLSSSVTMADGSFFNEFVQTFTPGSMLSFQLSLTTNLEASVPDEFSLAILDRSGVEIPTLGRSNALIIIDIDSAFPSLSAFPTNTSVSPGAGGPPINIAVPTVTLANVPEPGSLALVAAGGTALIFLIRRKYSGTL